MTCHRPGASAAEPVCSCGRLPMVISSSATATTLLVHWSDYLWSAAKTVDGL